MQGSLEIPQSHQKRTIMSQTMQRINIIGFGGVEVLHTESAPIPQPQSDEVLIRTTYAGVNRPDIMQREGKYPLCPRG